MSAIVYRFYDRAGALLYVGMTTVGPVRWGEHAVSQPWWGDVAHVTVVHCATVEEALTAEARAIQLEDPRYNVIHKRKSTVNLPARPYRPRRAAGSIYQRASDGRWIAAVSRGGRSNRRKIVVYRNTREEAERALEDMLA